MLSLRNTIARFLACLTMATIALAVPAAAHPTIDIVAANWHFTPSTITVDAGQMTTLRLTSTSGTHGIASDELGIAATTIAQGRFVEVSFTPHAAGTFAVHCSIYCGAGHPDMVLTVIVKAAQASTPAPTTIPAPVATAAPTPTPTPAPVRTPTPLVDDRHFIILMVHHARLGQQMAQVAAKSARHPEIRTLAKSLVARNAAAIAQLGHWYKAWYGSSVPDMPAMPAPAMHAMPATSSQSMAQMCMDMMQAVSPAALGKAPDLDRAFLIGTIHHESMGASVSLLSEQGLVHPELRKFARSSASVQLKDIQQLWHWFDGWYPEK